MAASGSSERVNEIGGGVGEAMVEEGGAGKDPIELPNIGSRL